MAKSHCAVLCQRARLEAIKQGVPVAVRFDTADRTVESWLDEVAATMFGDWVEGDPDPRRVCALAVCSDENFGEGRREQAALAHRVERLLTVADDHPRL